jgi:hypothetical protein
MDPDRIKTLAELFHFQPPLRGDQRRVIHRHIHDHDTFMQNLIVLEIVQQRAGNDIGARRQEHPQARHADGALVGPLQE